MRISEKSRMSPFVPQDVPMPDTSALPRAMFDAFVEVVFDLPGETDVDFVLNVMSREEVKGIVAQRWNSAPLNSTPFWVGYLLGGYQYQTVMDNDPDYGVDPQEQLPEWGVSSLDGKGGAVVWLETTWDRSRQLSQEGFGEQDTVVHEVGHLFGGGEPVTLIDQDAPCVYTEQYLAKIRSAAKPEGP